MTFILHDWHIIGYGFQQLTNLFFLHILIMKKEKGVERIE